MEYFLGRSGKEKPDKNPIADPLEIPINLKLESIERAQERGLSGKDSQMVGIAVGVARRKANMTVNELAEKSGQNLEDIIDLNLGTLSLSQAATIVEELKGILSIDEELLRRALLEDSKRKSSF